MSLFSSFKKALGFPEEYEDLDDLADLEDADETEATAPPETADPAEPYVAAQQNQTAETTESQLETLADRIVEVCVRNYPGDTSGQLRESIRTEVVGALDGTMAHIAGDIRSTYTREIADLRKASGEFDTQRRNFETSRLSADRQKRALNDRIADMEKQIRNLEAEREQLQLENQCMINKLRGASMPVVSGAAGSSDFKLLNEKNAELRHELNNVKRQLVMSEKRLKESGAADAPTKEQFKALQQEIESLTEQKNGKEKEILSLRDKLDIAQSSNAELGQRLSEANAKIENLEATIAQLNTTIQQNLADHASSEASMNDEVKRLREMLDRKEAPAAPQKKRGRKKSKEKVPEQETAARPAVKISAIDELMDNTDWFAAPEPGPRIKDPEVMESFGYKEQPRKSPKKYDENQLTLF